MEKCIAALLVVFFWSASDGSLGFAGEIEKVPLKYRAEVKSRTVEGGLLTYPKYSSGLPGPRGATLPESNHPTETETR